MSVILMQLPALRMRSPGAGKFRLRASCGIPFSVGRLCAWCQAKEPSGRVIGQLTSARFPARAKDWVCSSGAAVISLGGGKGHRFGKRNSKLENLASLRPD